MGTLERRSNKKNSSDQINDFVNGGSFYGKPKAPSVWLLFNRHSRTIEQIAFIDFFIISFPVIRWMISSVAYAVAVCDLRCSRIF